MTSGGSEKKTNFPFDYPSYDEWLAVARQELDGADPIEKLSIKKGNLEILPFYSAPLKESGEYSTLNPSSNPYLGARSWMNTPKILVSDEKNANEIAQEYLNSGAEGILFDCQKETINPAILLNKISLADCSVSFLVNEASQKWLPGFQLLAERNFNKSEIKGCIFWRSIPENYADIAQRFSLWTQFYSLGILVQHQENVTDEIAEALYTAVHLLNNYSEEKTNAQIILNQISFSVSTGTDFFLEIAKLKSLRNLWYQIRCACELKNDKPMHIHANSTAWIKDSFQPHGNMIKSTASAMASIAGGCDSLTVEPEDPTNETMSRIARNVSSILREESHFSKVADPTAGSYYIDSLTDQLSEKAWSKFQSLMK
jgi:methylmalonyl-CoA mutase